MHPKIINVLNNKIKEYFTHRSIISYKIIDNNSTVDFRELYEILFLKDLSIVEIIAIFDKLSRCYFVILLDYNISGIFKEVFRFIQKNKCVKQKISLSENNIIKSKYIGTNKEDFINTIKHLFS